MKLAKSLFLGSAAALATVAGAQAADLPVRKAAPVAVEYVRVCSTYGSGFFVIPGTDSCVKIGGRVRMDALIQERFNRRQDNFGYRARGRMSFDVRTPTPYGLLRTFVRFQITANSGSTVNGGSGAAGAFIDTVAQPTGRLNDPAQKTIVNQAFIQFGGLTAGRTTSFFSTTDLPTGHMGRCASTTTLQSVRVCLHLLLRQRLISHDFGRRSIRSSTPWPSVRVWTGCSRSSGRAGPPGHSDARRGRPSEVYGHLGHDADRGRAARGQ